MPSRCNKMSKSTDRNVLGSFEDKGLCAWSELRERVTRDEDTEDKTEPIVQGFELGFLSPGKDFRFYSMFNRKLFQGL